MSPVTVNSSMIFKDEVELDSTYNSVKGSDNANVFIDSNGKLWRTTDTTSAGGGDMYRADSTTYYMTLSTVKDSLNDHQTQFSAAINGKQATIANLADTSNYYERGDTTSGVTGRIATWATLRDTAAAIRASIGGGSGETNTMSNITGSGVGIYKSKTGVNFDMKRLKAVTLNPLTITDATDSVLVSDGWTYSYVTTNQSNNTRGTPTALWAIAVDASSKYEFEGMVIDTGAATTTGTVFYVSASGTVAGSTMIFETNANTTLGTDQQAADQCLLTSSSVSDSSVFATRGVVNPATSYIKGQVRTNANARTYTIGYKSEISGSAVVVMAGSYIRYRKLPY